MRLLADQLITTEMIDECSAYVRGGAVPPSRETIDVIMSRLGDLMEDNAQLIAQLQNR